MATDSFEIDKGDTLPALIATLRDGAGTAKNITGTTVTFFMRDPASGTLKINGAAVSLLDAANGRVQYNWTTTDTNTAQTYLAYFRVTWPGGATENYPTDHQITVEVLDPAATISASLAYCTSGDLRRFGTDTAEADDPEMSEVCLLASRVVDDYCGVEAGFFGAAASSTLTLYDVRTPIVPLPLPFSTVTAVSVDGRALDPTTYTVTTYGVFLGLTGMFDADGFPRRTFTQISPTRYGYPYGSRVAVTATFGWGTIPKPVKRATARIAARLAKESDSEMLDPSLTNITVEGYSRSWNYGISQQREMSSTGDAIADRLLRAYVRPMVA